VVLLVICVPARLGTLNGAVGSTAGHPSTFRLLVRLSYLIVKRDVARYVPDDLLTVASTNAV
jgi:hypothetical protein